jgi:hypothetical protein
VVSGFFVLYQSKEQKQGATRGIILGHVMKDANGESDVAYSEIARLYCAPSSWSGSWRSIELILLNIKEMEREI